MSGSVSICAQKEVLKRSYTKFKPQNLLTHVGGASLGAISKIPKSAKNESCSPTSNKAVGETNNMPIKAKDRELSAL